MSYNGVVKGSADLKCTWESATFFGKKEAGMGKRKGLKYKPDLPKLLYTFFISYTDTGAPSFSKFARSIGATMEEIENFKKYGEFERAWRECSEIRRDYLIDSALARRHDPSFTKFLLSSEYGMGEKEHKDDGSLEVKLEVIEN